MMWILFVHTIQRSPLMTLHVNLSPEMEGFIKNKVNGGFYGNATEVIRDAIRRMQAEETRAAAWHAAIKLGDEQLDRNDATEYNSAALADITKAAAAAVRSNKPMDPDVLP